MLIENSANIKPGTLLIFTVTLLLGFLVSSGSSSFESNAKSAFVVDDLTGTILLEKNPTKRIPPASMSKLMTLYMVFDALRDERIFLTDTIRVSKNASQKGGSKMFLNEGQKVSIEDILRGIIIHSGNDACIAIAEALSGTEKEFAREMNVMAEDLGLVNSYFTNSTGWPDENHFMSAADLVNIATRIRIEFPNFYKYFAEDSFTWNKITQKNRNPMLNKGLGADGFKTGHTEAAGYGLVGSAKRGNRRVTFIISGMDTNKQRTIESEKIINWAYRDFKAKRILKQNQIIGIIPVWLGAKKTVPLYAKEDVYILMPTSKNINVKSLLTYNRPIQAPFKAGQQSPAKLKLIYDIGSKTASTEYDLFASEGSEIGNFFTRVNASVTIFLNYIKSAIK